MATPSLTVKAAAEMLALPAHSQSRILTEQKYPKVGSQAFKTPYYRTAVSGIAAFFRNGGSPRLLEVARSKAEGLAQESKKKNNLRVLSAFEKSDFARRDFSVATSPRISASIDNVTLRLSPDLRLVEHGTPSVVYLNCRGRAVDPDAARRTLEIAHWVLEETGEPIKISQLEYVDLFRNTSYTFKTRRLTTISTLKQNARIIDALWPAL